MHKQPPGLEIKPRISWCKARGFPQPAPYFQFWILHFWNKTSVLWQNTHLWISGIVLTGNLLNSDSVYSLQQVPLEKEQKFGHS